ncbi:DNA-directed RNA polymerase subunit alpha C-terminal domain-containing protein [Anaerocolumna sp. MB42-C2]|uniref:DNA-directed RNA polymerase subunit alpha C-terminal domain-containing protein n=1 Tax=Anaerocolumna sp. MB42-C2 TaxID=3070997 RepID=UPI0027E05919|nr:DNA-directed RNA polymerase subunit alpha C-terminal domain-containing protein [Anaerocolumna sp. MB42-C2]WMJ85472.1 DNA-directed RNA polymerase subunit alpha C-terminal domain-containing protein [Anaerocolumna sp. MB42-C2]
MSINDRFSKDGNSPMIQEEYKGFSISKLSEMLTLTDNQMEQITLTTTVAQIKDIKKSYATSHKTESEEKLIEPLSKTCKYDGNSNCVAVCDTGAECCAECPEHGSCNGECGWQDERIPKREKSIDDLDFSVRTYNCLKRASIDTIEQLCGMTEDEVITIRSMSQKCLDEIKLKLSEIGKEMKSVITTYKLNGEPYGATRSEIIVSLIAEMIKNCTEIEGINGDCCSAFGIDYWAYNIKNDGYITIENENGNPIFRTSIERFKHEYDWHKVRLASRPPEKPEEDEDKETMNDTPESVTETAEIMNDIPKTVIDQTESISEECEGCKLNGNSDAGIMECHPERGEHMCWIADESEKSEIVEADVIHTEKDNSDPERYSISEVQWEITNHTKNLDILRKDNCIDSIRHKTKMRLDAATALFDKLQEPVIEAESKSVQPELPILKNNDQRKDFIDNYTSWPIWIDQELTGERYYRYDFEDGTSFVIRVSLQHAYKGYERTADIKYGHEEYFLLGAKNQWIPGMPTFTESSTNKSAMVEHLKEIQKKGA